MIYQKDECYLVIGAAMEVYNTLGPGFLEQVYQEALEKEFQLRGIPYVREKELVVYYKGTPLRQTYKADFVCYGNIIVELKAVSHIDDPHRAQVYNYLHATGHHLALLINFGNYTKLEYERKVVSKL